MEELVPIEKCKKCGKSETAYVMRGICGTIEYHCISCGELCVTYYATSPDE